jgi:hypothetical protein
MHLNTDLLDVDRANVKTEIMIGVGRSLVAKIGFRDFFLDKPKRRSVGN